MIPRRPSVRSDRVLLIMVLLLSHEKSRESFRTNSTSMWFLILFQVFITFKTVDEILRCNHLNESYKVVLTFKTVDEILNYYHSNESYWNSAFPWYCLLCYTNWCLPLSLCGFCERSSNVCQFKWKLLIRIFCGGTIYYSVWGRFNRPESAWDPNLVKGQNVSKGSNLISYVNISSLCIRWGFPCQQKTLLTLFCPICAVCVFPTNEVNRQVTDLLNWRLYFKRDRLVRTSTTFCLRFDREIVFVTTREF